MAFLLLLWPPKLFSLPKLPGELNRLLNMNGRREGEVHIPFNFCVLLSRWLNMIVLAVMYLIRGYFPSAQLTVPLCCSSGVHTASGHGSPLAYFQLLATHAHLQECQNFEGKKVWALCFAFFSWFTRNRYYFLNVIFFC